MSVSVTKSGPYFSSGSISFSQLRSNFKETSSGAISVSELRRNTNVSEANPIVPDSTENEQITTGSNWRLSQFRNSVKRYTATQSGTDDNGSYPGEPGFRMGLYASNGKGIDWSGGGVSGRDGQSGSRNGNLIKNVQKIIKITGTCGSYYQSLPAAQLSPAVTVNNVRIEVSGSILGYGGKGGYNPQGYPVGNASGEDGGTALNFGTIGVNNRLTVLSGGKIYGGGGGGEQGQNGERGSAGTCVYEYNTQSCGGTPLCFEGGNIRTTWSGRCCESYSVGFPAKERCGKWINYAVCRIEKPSTTPIQGIGGRGGNGQGYNQSRTSGQSGSTGTCPTCDGNFALSGGSCGTNGKRGGDGGNWGQDGGETSGNRTRGRAGAAITRSGSNTYSYTNRGDVRGATNL